jgi:hypothetical protein
LNKTLLNRLAALEAARPVAPKPVSPWPMVLHKLIAFHLGEWDREKDSPAEAFARATGWTTPENRSTLAMQAAMGNGDPLYEERYQAALRRMFAARGVDIDGDDMPAVLGVLIAEAEAGGVAMPELSAEAR